MRASFILFFSLILQGCVTDPSKSPEVRRLSAISQLRLLQLSDMAEKTAYYVDKHGLAEAAEKSKESVKNKLKDPDSARFRNIKDISLPDGVVFCGEVNSKNSYGGYVGFTWFVAGVNGANIFTTSNRHRDASEDAANNISVSTACKVY